MNSPSIVYFGTDEFAAIVLEKLVQANFDIKAVVMPPDEPVGRKKIITPPPIKTVALRLNLNVLQPRLLKDFEMPECDLGVVVVYGKIIPKKMLTAPKHGFLNIHPSLLPKYRGPSPIKTAIANGDDETGVTIIGLDSEMDHGPIIDHVSCIINHDEKHAELRNKLANLGAELLIKTIPKYVAGHIEARPQDHDKATHTRMLTKEDGKVSLQDDPQMIYNKFRAYHEWPNTWFMHHGSRVIIRECKLINGKLEIILLQPEGKKPMTMQEFTNGYGRIAS